MKLIDKDKVVKEIERRVEAIRKAFNETGILYGVDRTYANAQSDAFKSLLTFLDTLEVKEVDAAKVYKHSYFETIYHCGTEPLWKVGDILAAYEFYSDHEGEYVYGEVIGVKNDETHGDWIYTMRRDFGEYEVIYEKELISQEAYKKNK